METNFETKDSGQRQDYASGMRRDVQTGKPRFDLIYKPLLWRWAELMARGAEKYGDRNWEKANSQEELDRALASAERHFQQFIRGDKDEDHGAATCFNIGQVIMLREKLEKL